MAKGHKLFDVLRVACLNPALHYRLPVGLLREGDPADFIMVDNLEDFNVLETYINGQKVAERGVSFLPDLRSPMVNQFDCRPCHSADLAIEAPAEQVRLKVIEALDGQLITNALEFPARIKKGYIVPDVENDILKIVVVNRYRQAPVAVGFIKNFGLKEGAIASSVAHDSHNIIAVGCDDESLAKAINLVIEAKGGVSAIQDDKTTFLLALPIAGLMSDEDGYEVARQYTAIDDFVKKILKSSLTSPFMTLSFMALLVIPSLKMSDLGIFDGRSFNFAKYYFEN